MENSELQSTLRKVEQLLSKYKFKLTHSQFNPELFGNYYVDISNGKHAYRITKDRSQYFLEGKNVNSDDWNDINQYVEGNFEGSILALDMKLHKMGKGDFSLETILKLLPKLLLLSEEHKSV
jgi:hypothetical protein